MNGKFLKIIRIKEWVHFLGVPFLGYLFFVDSISAFSVIVIFIISIATLAFGFVVNYWADPGNRPVKTLLCITFTLPIISIFLLVNQLIYPLIFWTLLIIALCSYSIPPFTLKRFPLISTFINGFSLSLFFLFGSSFATSNLYSILLALFFGLHLIPPQILHEFEDRKEDKKSGHRSMAHLFSPAALIRITLALYLLIVIISYLISRANNFTFLFIATLLFSGFSMFTIKNKFTEDISRVRKKIKIAGIIYSLFILINLL